MRQQVYNKSYEKMLPNQSNFKTNSSTIPLQFEEVDFQMQVDAQASKFQASNLKNLIIWYL